MITGILLIHICWIITAAVFMEMSKTADNPERENVDRKEIISECFFLKTLFHLIKVFLYKSSLYFLGRIKLVVVKPCNKNK